GASAGNVVNQSACVNGTNQQFLFAPVNGGYKVTARNSPVGGNLALGVRGGPAATANGALIQVAYYNATPDQVWIATLDAAGYYVLTLANSGKCLEDVGSATVQQNACAGSSKQEWTLSAPLPTYILARTSQKCLSIGSSPKALGAGNLADQYTCAGGTNQEFTLVPVNGGYKIVASHSKLALGVRGGPTMMANGALIQQAYYNATPDQVWTITSGSGCFMLQINNSGKCLDVKSVSDGALMQQNACSGALSQQWTFAPIPQ